jgi:uncharacterized protein (TIGR04255 family)
VLDPERPIYPNAPLKLVTFQIQFPLVPDLDDLTPHKEIADALRERYPIIGGPPPFVQLDLGSGQAQQRARGSRMTNRSRTWTVTMMSDTISIETSRYQRYEKFAEQVEWVLERVHNITPLPAVTRVGMRYIDEIEIEGADELGDWTPWINEHLIVGGLIDGYRTHDYVVQSLLEVDDFRRMVVRYGRITQPVVNPDGVLRIDNSPVGPYFLLDIDSFWEPSTDEFLEFKAEEVREVSLSLHDPIREIFERAITPALRERFTTTAQVEEDA